MSGIDFSDADLDLMLKEINEIQTEENAAKAPKPALGDDSPISDDDDLQALETELKSLPEEPVASAAPEPEPEPKPEPKSELATDELSKMEEEIMGGHPAGPEPEHEPASKPAHEPVKPEPSKTVSSPVVQAFVQPDVLRADVAINPADLDSAMTTHTSMYVHYATQAVMARKQFDRYKNALEILEARLDAEYRASLSEGGKKCTEGQIRAAVTNDKRWAVANSRVIDAQSASRLADIAERAFDQRRDLLLEMARDRRKEREGELRVSAHKDAMSDIVQALRDAKKVA